METSETLQGAETGAGSEQGGHASNGGTPVAAAPVAAGAVQAPPSNGTATALNKKRKKDGLKPIVTNEYPE